MTFNQILRLRSISGLGIHRTVLVHILQSKLSSYGIGGKTLKWIDSFLCIRQQRVVVNGVKSDWVPVLSGVPQGTVLGPLLFSLYINDISSDIESEIRFFADDYVCYSEIKDEVDSRKFRGILIDWVPGQGSGV